jgi:hypothetical protein
MSLDESDTLAAIVRVPAEDIDAASAQVGLPSGIDPNARISAEVQMGSEFESGSGSPESDSSDSQTAQGDGSDLAASDDE